MRFSQPMTKNVQRRIKELPECQKAEDITGESSLIQWHATTLARCSLRLIIGLTLNLIANQCSDIFTKDSYVLLCLSFLKNVPLRSSSNLWVIIYHWLSLNCRGETMEGCNFHLLPQFAGMFLRCLLSEL